MATLPDIDKLTQPSDGRMDRASATERFYYIGRQVAAKLQYQKVPSLSPGSPDQGNLVNKHVVTIATHTGV